jgi:hypothetical protein
MTEMDLSALESLRGKRVAQKKPEWQPLDLSTLQPGTYLAADPSLTAFGLVMFEVAPEQRYTVHMAQKFSTPAPSGKADHEDTLSRAETIQILIAHWLKSYVVGHDWGNLKYVHEAPPIGGGKLMKPEVSLVTGLAFRMAIKEAYLPTGRMPTLLPMMYRREHCKLICGQPDAKKPFHHAALKEHFDAIRGADELITNEAHRDALSVALAAAHRGF